MSVLMPVHNAGRHLEAAVASILQQENVTLELIIINDHSSDNALEGLIKDPRLSIINSRARGIVHALNTGIEASRHPFIARMDADDIAAPTRISLQLSLLLSKPEIDVCGTKVHIFRDDGDVAGGYLEYQDWINSLCEHQQIEKEFFVESPIAHPTAMMRTTSLRALGGYHDSVWPEDYDLWCRALLSGMKFAKPFNEGLLHWRDHTGRLSRTDERYGKQQFLRCKAHYLNLYLKKRNISHYNIWGVGPTGLKLHDYLVEEGMQIERFIDINPSMQGRLKRGKPVEIISIDEDSAGLFEFLFEGERSTMIIVAVAARGARAEIRCFFDAKGLVEGGHYIFAA